MYRKKMMSMVMAAGLLAANISAPAQAVNSAAEASAARQEIVAKDTIRVSSNKGTILNVGDRSLLIIGPYGDEYAAKSNAPAIVDVEQVLGFWVAVAKKDGKATITVQNRKGESKDVEITVGTWKAAQPMLAPEAKNTGVSPSTESGQNSGEKPDAGLETRQEMIRRINEYRAANGLAELPVNEPIMEAAQDIAEKRLLDHSLYEWESLEAHGWMHGAGVNLTRFNGQQNLQNIAEHAVSNWINSHYHRLTMLDERVTCIGVGVTVYRGTAYCVMIAGDPNSISPIG